uniref:FBA_2 domain-containing protein n=1 Tax=Steinernema glaseri TaxID=37863 RepID=A0A1I8A034_9BILA
MDSVPFAFCLAVVHTLPTYIADLYRRFVQSDSNHGSNHSNLLRLSNSIWREAVLSLSKDEEDDKTKYRVMAYITIYPGEKRGMCFCELNESTTGFAKAVTLKDVESSRFLRSGNVCFENGPPRREEFEHISLKEAFIKLVIPFSADGVDFRIREDHLFFVDVLNNLHKHQLVCPIVRLRYQASEIYEKVETELNNFLIFQIQQRCLRHFYAPDRSRTIPFSIPKDVFLKLFNQPQLETTTDFPVALSTEVLEEFIAKWKNSSTDCGHDSLMFDDNLDHEDLQRMGFKEITKWKKFRRFITAVGLGSRISPYRWYRMDSPKYRLYVGFSTVTRMGQIRTHMNQQP